MLLITYHVEKIFCLHPRRRLNIRDDPIQGHGPVPADIVLGFTTKVIILGTINTVRRHRYTTKWEPNLHFKKYTGSSHWHLQRKQLTLALNWINNREHEYKPTVVQNQGSAWTRNGDETTDFTGYGEVKSLRYLL